MNQERLDPHPDRAVRLKQDRAVNDRIAERFAARRKNLGATQEELNEAIGVAPKWVESFERGEIMAPWPLVERMAELLNMTHDDLVQIKGQALGKQEKAA